MKKYSVIGLFAVLALLFAIPLSAAEKVKIKLPDGLYMYDSSIERLQDGRVRVGFGKYFVVCNNKIYSSKEAVKKFGILKLNKLFTENKKYKILFGGEQIGKIYNVRIDNEEDWDYKEEFFTKSIKEGPAYWEKSLKIIIPRMGSAAKCLVVPEEYKEVKKIVYTTIPQEEIDKIAKLIKEKLLPLVINRKEVRQYKIEEKELYKEDLMLLDKMSYRNNDFYIGIYRYMFEIQEYFIVFSVIKENIYIITSNYSDDIPDYDGAVSVYGMLDVDGDDNEELIMEKVFSGPDKASYNIEIYRQESDGKWTVLQRISWEVKS